VYLATKGYVVIVGVRNSKAIDMYNQQEEDDGSSSSGGGTIVPIILDVTKEADIDKALETVTIEVEKRKVAFAGLVSGGW